MIDDPVAIVEKRLVEIQIRRAIDLMDCASCAAKFVNISPGCPGIEAALCEASNTLSDVLDMLGITEPDPQTD